MQHHLCTAPAKFFARCSSLRIREELPIDRKIIKKRESKTWKCLQRANPTLGCYLPLRSRNMFGFGSHNFMSFLSKEETRGYRLFRGFLIMLQSGARRIQSKKFFPIVVVADKKQNRRRLCFSRACSLATYYFPGSGVLSLLGTVFAVNKAS